MKAQHQGVKGKGTKHIVYWRTPNGNDGQSLKVNLIIYENDVMQVKHTLCSNQKYSVLLKYWIQNNVGSCQYGNVKGHWKQFFLVGSWEFARSHQRGSLFFAKEIKVNALFFFYAQVANIMAQGPEEGVCQVIWIKPFNLFHGTYVHSKAHLQ